MICVYFAKFRCWDHGRTSENVQALFNSNKNMESLQSWFWLHEIFPKKRNIFRFFEMNSMKREKRIKSVTAPTCSKRAAVPWCTRNENTHNTDEANTTHNIYNITTRELSDTQHTPHWAREKEEERASERTFVWYSFKNLCGSVSVRAWTWNSSFRC